MDDGKASQRHEVWQAPQPSLVLLRQLVAGPLDVSRGTRGETVQRTIRRTILVVIPFEARDSHLSDDVHALLRMEVVADDISQASEVRASLGLSVFQDSLQRR